jgi:zinc transport system substrate-binding protein
LLHDLHMMPINFLFHTIHNASQEEINDGETYISLMQKNLQNLKQALS